MNLLTLQVEPTHNSFVIVLLTKRLNALLPRIRYCGKIIFNMKILLIDDEVSVLDSLKNVLSELNHVCVCANNAVDAVAIIENGDFDFALVDYKMPGHDGIWFMKNASIPPKTKVLLMTANVNREIINEMFKLGARGYLIKPFTDGEIQQHLDFHSK